jgi:dihydropteroate synthase
MTDAGSHATATPGRVLFVTGRLAEPSLRRVLGSTALPFAHDVAVLRITVAALMTTAWIARHLSRDEVPAGTDLVMIPGLCEGDPEEIAATLGIRVEKGPDDLRELPAHFGRPAEAAAYGDWDIEIVAEINNAPRLTRDQIRRAADYFHESGANVIDVGCTPGLSFPALGDVVRELTASGRRVSVDTFDAHEIRTAVAAGAELVLSVNGSNIEVANDLAGTRARVVAVPELGGDLDSLDPTLDALAKRGIPHLIDPILEPIGHGFTASIERYATIRRRYPEAEMLMGIGNLTELTAADSTGVHAVLIAVCQELGIRTVLTTEVIPWATGAVREVDIARRLMHYAVTQRTIPKGIDDRLVTVKDPALLEFTEDELRALQAGISDPNFRIFTDQRGVTVLNNERFVRSTNVNALDQIFAQLAVDEPSHAFYLGTELAKAALAVTLGKTYRQDAPLRWGYLTPGTDEPKRTRLTARATRTPSAEEPKTRE